MDDDTRFYTLVRKCFAKKIVMLVIECAEYCDFRLGSKGINQCLGL